MHRASATLAVLEPPALFGEVSVLFVEPRWASVQAVANTDVWGVTKQDLWHIFMVLPAALRVPGRGPGARHGP